MRIRLALTWALAIAPVSPAAAQDPAAGGAPTGVERASDFQEPFVDAGNAAAKALAEQRGITVGEATRSLRRAHAAGLLARKFQRENRNEFGGTYVDGNGITVFLKSGSLNPSDALGRAKSAIDADLAPSIRIVAVKRSIADMKSHAARLETQLGKSEHLVGFRIDTKTNQLSILSRDVERTRSQVREKLGSTPEDVTIEASAPIELTQGYAYGGTAANNGSTIGCPSFGFVVIRPSDSLRGIVTVAHAATTDMRYNGYSSTALSSCSGGTYFSQKGVYQNADPELAGTDFAWYTYSSIGFPATFWDGSQLATVYGATYPAGGSPVCKFGRKTLRTCGTTTGAEVYSSGYGWMMEVQKNAGYAQMNDVGDSGGPVWFSSGTAVGVVHAKQGTEIMLVATFAAFVERNLPIRVLCQC
jgi:hypothetical protein